MVILIGSDGKTVNSSVAPRFGHAAYFILFNTESKSFATVENKDDDHDHKNLYEFVKNGVEAFIVGNIGPFAFKIVNTPRSKVFLARSLSVQEAIDKFVSNALPVLTEPTAKHSIGHGHTTHSHIGSTRR
ncbi:MAG: NifB/NifX family molybdenum-iron cluster-binding protein [Bacteroidota bacterium]